MDTLQQRWENLLARQESLLKELIDSIKLERETLLANEVEALRAATLAKDKTTRKLALLKEEMRELKERCIRELGLKVDAPLDRVFETLGTESCRLLQRKRAIINTLTTTVRRQNEFIATCLDTYTNHLSNIRSLLTLVYDHGTTYRADGSAKGATHNSIINRSI